MSYENQNTQQIARLLINFRGFMRRRPFCEQLLSCGRRSVFQVRGQRASRRDTSGARRPLGPVPLPAPSPNSGCQAKPEDDS